jgi:hypothetical protein
MAESSTLAGKIGTREAAFAGLMKSAGGGHPRNERIQKLSRTAWFRRPVLPAGKTPAQLT